jgi:hypothetical protein
VQPREVSSFVYLLLNGKILLNQHSLQKPGEIEIVQVCRPGQFLGLDEVDFG